jgi:hypothetical protein
MFDMAVLNDLDRFHLAMDAIDRLPQLGSQAVPVKAMLIDYLTEHRQHIRHYGQDTGVTGGAATKAVGSRQQSADGNPCRLMRVLLPSRPTRCVRTVKR